MPRRGFRIVHAAWARGMTGERGMTLTELMVVLVVMSITVGAIYSILSVSFQAFAKGSMSTQAQQGGRLAVDRISRDLRQARRLISGVSAGGFSFNLGGTGCTQTAPQISFVLPHYATVTLSDGSTQAYIPDASASGSLPYDGTYVSYYLSATQNGSTANAAGPYLNRTTWDVVAAPGSVTTLTVAGNVTSLGFQASGACPGTASRDITVTLTTTQTASNQNVTATDTVTLDVTLRNQ